MFRWRGIIVAGSLQVSPARWNPREFGHRGIVLFPYQPRVCSCGWPGRWTDWPQPARLGCLLVRAARAQDRPVLASTGLDTTTPAGKAMFQMLGVFAEFERAIIAERVRAGLAHARGEGKRLGRPPIAPALEKRIPEALATPGRPGVRVIAKQFGVNPGTVQRISRPFAAAIVARTAVEDRVPAITLPRTACG
jgi:Resolvase, N terminal domain